MDGALPRLDAEGAAEWANSELDEIDPDGAGCAPLAAVCTELADVSAPPFRVATSSEAGVTPDMATGVTTAAGAPDTCSADGLDTPSMISGIVKSPRIASISSIVSGPNSRSRMQATR